MALELYHLFLVISIIFLLKLNAKRTNKNKTSLPLPPSPPKLPILGNFHQLGTLPHRSLQSHSRKHGPLMLLHLGHVPTLVVSSAELAEEIMKTQDLIFASRPITTASHQLFYGCNDVAFSPYGEYWRQVKKLCVVQLLSTKRVNSFRHVREEEVEVLLERLSQSKYEGVNISELLLSLTSGIITRVAFGKKYEKEAAGGKNEFAELAKELMVLLGEFFVGDYFPWLAGVDALTGLKGRLKRTFHGLDALLDQVIADHLAETKKGDKDGMEPKDLVDVLLSLQKDSSMEIRLSKDNIKAIILDMFVAGTDTSAITIEWAMTELIRHPHVMEKALVEVRQVVGKDSKVEEDHLRHLNYVKLVIKETLRLHVAAPLLGPRESSVDVSMQGYHIPAKTRVFVNAWAIARDPESWKNADVFIPERFANGCIDFKGQNFEYTPFGAGRRMCPGWSFAIVTVELVLANLLHWFDWELPQGQSKDNLDMSESFGITVHKKVPLRLVPKPHFL